MHVKMSVKETKTLFSKVVRFINANPVSADATVRQNITIRDLVRMKVKDCGGVIWKEFQLYVNIEVVTTESLNIR
jgi:hypothetical protein